MNNRSLNDPHAET